MSSTELAGVLVDELIRGGVRDAVLAPGSRSAPLAFALHAADAEGRLRLHVRIDERSAAFLALGLAKVSGRPVPIVTTSGTAAANLHPAVLEASESGLPLLLLTTDRPPELRATGASQTVDQVKLYGDAVRLFHELGTPRSGQHGYWRSVIARAIAVAAGADPGPVQLNLAFADPLVPPVPSPPVPPGRPDGRAWTEIAPQPEPVAPGADGWPARTLVIVGDARPALGAAAVRLAEAYGWPVIAEPSSGARFGPAAVRLGHLLLGQARWLEAHRPDRVLLVGHPTLHRSVGALTRREDVEVVVVGSSRRFADATRTAAVVLPTVPEPGAHHPITDPSWLAAWRDADQAAIAAREAVLGRWPAPTEAAIADTVLAALPPGSLLIAGSSMPVRELASARLREGVTVLANRGVAGIDGTVSTAIGAALAWQRDGGGPAAALLGDLTFLHDSTGLIIGPAESRPDLTVVVVNNDGGAIFALLEQGAPDHAAVYERVFGTPHGTDLEALCAASGTHYVRATTSADLARLVPAGPGITVAEIRTDRSGARNLDAEIRSAVTAVLG